MTGTPAERHLLGAVLSDNRVHRLTDGLVSGNDFGDGRLGALWDGITNLITQGGRADAATVTMLFPEWDIRGIPEQEVWDWVGPDVLPHEAPKYATAVRAAALRRGSEAAGRALIEAARDTGVQPADAITTIRTHLGELVDGATSGRLVAKRLDEVLAMEHTYDWVVPHLLERMDRIIITGEEGLGKSQLLAQIALMTAAGLHPFVSATIRPCRVLIVDAENTYKQWGRRVRFLSARLAQEGLADPRKNIYLHAEKRLDITKGTDLAEVHRLVDRHRPDILVIGPLYKLTSGAINDDNDATPLIIALDSLRERNLCLVMEAHAGKATDVGGDRKLAPIGSSALLRWPEFGYGLGRIHGGDDDLVAFRPWRGDREARAWPDRLRRGNPEYEWPWMGDWDKPEYRPHVSNWVPPTTESAAS